MDCWFMFKNASKIQIRDMCENGKPGIVMKIVWGLYLKMKDHSKSNFRKEVVSVICSSRSA